jgi:hypothetical protein
VCEPCYRASLHRRGTCAGCGQARRTAALLTDPATGDVPATLAPVAAALAGAPQPYSALNWLRKGAGAAILAELATGRLPVSLKRWTPILSPPPRSTCGACTAHGILPERDEELARVERWVAELLEAIDRPSDRRLLSAYAT